MGHLLQGFFNYFSAFDFKKRVVRVSHPSPVTKKEKEWAAAAVAIEGAAYIQTVSWQQAWDLS